MNCWDLEVITVKVWIINWGHICKNDVAPKSYIAMVFPNNYASLSAYDLFYNIGFLFLNTKKYE